MRAGALTTVLNTGQGPGCFLNESPLLVCLRSQPQTHGVVRGRQELRKPPAFGDPHTACQNAYAEERQLGRGADDKSSRALIPGATVSQPQGGRPVVGTALLPAQCIGVNPEQPRCGQRSAPSSRVPPALSCLRNWQRQPFFSRVFSLFHLAVSLYLISFYDSLPLEGCSFLPFWFVL